MTPLPSAEELKRRHIYDPVPGTIHVLDLVNMAKDGLYNKDLISDHLIGVLYFAEYLEVVKNWEIALFQVPFVAGGKIRSNTRHVGRPFLDPDGSIITVAGRCLHGDGKYLKDKKGNDRKHSILDWDDITAHVNFDSWLKRNFGAGRKKEATSYIRTGTLNAKKAIDDYVNSRPYTPGPESVAPHNIEAEVPATPSNWSRKRSAVAAELSEGPEIPEIADAPKVNKVSGVQEPSAQEISGEDDIPDEQEVVEKGDLSVAQQVPEAPEANQVTMTFEVRNLSSLSFNLDLSGEPTFTLKYTLKPPGESA